MALLAELGLKHPPAVLKLSIAPLRRFQGRAFPLRLGLALLLAAEAGFHQQASPLRPYHGAPQPGQGSDNA